MKTLDAFERDFQTDDACKAYLASKRWPGGVRCPRCKATERIYALKARPFHWSCKNTNCGGRNGYRFSVTTATIFEDTKVSLKVWFRIAYLILSAKKGISARQVHRVVFGEESGSDYRTTWYICQRWRAAMRGDAFPLSGIVEVDETYIGGKDRNRHKGKKSADMRRRAGRKLGDPGDAIGFGKVGVIGAIARKGNVVAAVIGSMDARDKASFVGKTVSENVNLVVTDRDHAYNYVRMGMPHETVDHGRGEYVRGLVHTNTMESYWSLIKRGVMGQFHHVSKDYLPLYLNEFSFRFNNRKNPDIFGELVTTCASQ